MLTVAKFRHNKNEMSKPGKVAHSCDPSIWETEAGGSHCCLHSESQDRLGYETSLQKPPTIQDDC